MEQGGSSSGRRMDELLSASQDVAPIRQLQSQGNPGLDYIAKSCRRACLGFFVPFNLHLIGAMPVFMVILSASSEPAGSVSGSEVTGGEELDKTASPEEEITVKGNLVAFINVTEGPEQEGDGRELGIQEICDTTSSESQIMAHPGQDTFLSTVDESTVLIPPQGIGL